MNRSETTDEIDDDLDWEDWLSLTDAQHDAILDREMAAYSKWFGMLTPLQQYRHRRQRLLETCMNWRRSIQRLDLEVFREHLRTCQRLLLKARVDFLHGTQGSGQ